MTIATSTQQSIRTPVPAQATNSNPTTVRLSQSPTTLPYPPNPYQKEWWGRCFRCARKGHVIADCTFPRLIPAYAKKTQSDGIGSKDAPKPAASFSTLAPPYLPIHRLTTPEPTYDELLTGSEPHTQPPMPSDRLKKACCYFNKDQQYLHTSQKLLKGIVVQPPPPLAGQLTLDQVAHTVAASNKVSPAQLQVAIFPQDRFLVLLPNTIERDEVVAAIPESTWDEGYRFHSYSPLWDASISIPIFKVWLDVHGVPLELCTDSHLARAVSSFGTFLGSIEPQKHGDYQTCSLFITTDDLALIPHELEFRIGGMLYTVSIHPRKWLKGPVFHRVDLPPMWFSYPPPPPPATPPTSPSSSHLDTMSVDPIWLQGDDVIPVSLKALREIFRDFNPSDLPKDLAACLAGDRTAVSANHETYCLREQQSQASSLREHQSQASTSTNPPPYRATTSPAALDPTHSVSITPKLTP